jgi:hypothetical protein
MGNYKIKYPCGLEIEADLGWTMAPNPEALNEKAKKCPMHGKKCKK